jgi:hypothetical protein
MSRFPDAPANSSLSVSGTLVYAYHMGSFPLPPVISCSVSNRNHPKPTKKHIETYDLQPFMPYPHHLIPEDILTVYTCAFHLNPRVSPDALAERNIVGENSRRVTHPLIPGLVLPEPSFLVRSAAATA